MNHDGRSWTLDLKTQEVLPTGEQQAPSSLELEAQGRTAQPLSQFMMWVHWLQLKLLPQISNQKCSLFVLQERSSVLS